MKYFFILSLCLCGLIHAQESNEAYKIYEQDTILGGSLMLAMNEDIEGELNKSVSENCAKLKNQNTVVVRRNSSSNSSSSSSTYEESISTRSADPCKVSPKVLGYKIQVFHSNNRQSAEAKLREVKSQFGYLSPEISYSKPTYRVLLGDYFTKRSASLDLSIVKKRYGGAFLVQWRVWCRRAK